MVHQHAPGPPHTPGAHLDRGHHRRPRQRHRPEGGQGAAARRPRPRPGLRPAALPQPRHRHHPGRPPGPQIGFNYLGRFTTDQGTDAHWLAVGDTGAGSALGDAELPFAHALEINAATHDTPDGPRLTVDLAWPAALFDAPDVEHLAALWQQALQALRDHAESPEAGGLTPSDLTLVGLSQQHIDLLEAKLRK
ncbi:hypothetical protein [Kitasatospora acidiphila]|uniref:hypothetical protein n=1 Tax=Kitasatospora acidiphila TaxID=2567942 RepID=UPI002265AD71|nr:hypothetical protein [Kitasatospora acidiphila]